MEEEPSRSSAQDESEINSISGQIEIEDQNDGIIVNIKVLENEIGQNRNRKMEEEPSSSFTTQDENKINSLSGQIKGEDQNVSDEITEESSCSFAQDENEINSMSRQIKGEDQNVCEEITEKIKVPENEIGQNSNDFSIPGLPEDYKDTYQAYINKVKALASIPITESMPPECIKNFKHFNLRYYEDKYCINFAVAETGYNDVLIRIHSNKLFLISLASGNDIITCDKKIIGINFVINNNDRSKVKLGGKRKRGAKVIEPHTILCQVQYAGIPKMFNIRAGVPGRILEINEHVKKDPDLLRTDPKGYGYLAVVAPKGHPSNYENVLKELKLLSEDEYIKHLTERTPKVSEKLKEFIIKD